MKKTLRIGVGFVFLVLGIAGLFLPLLQGILFIIIGLLLLAPYSPFIRKRLDAFKLRHPAMYRKSQAVKKKLAGIVRRR